MTETTTDKRVYTSAQKDLVALLLFCTTVIGYVASVLWSTRVAPRLLLRHELLLERYVSEAESVFNKSASAAEPADKTKEPSEVLTPPSENTSQLVDVIRKKRHLTRMKKMLSSCRKERGRYEVDVSELFSPTHSGSAQTDFFETVLASKGAAPGASPPVSPHPLLSSDDSSSWVSSSTMTSKEASHQPDGAEGETPLSGEKDLLMDSNTFCAHLPAGLRTLYWLPKWLHFYYLFIYFNVSGAVTLLLRFSLTAFVAFHFKSEDLWHNLTEIPDEGLLACMHVVFRYALSLVTYMLSSFFATALLVSPLRPTVEHAAQDDDTRSFRTEPCGIWWWCAVSYLIVRFAHRVLF